jgi:limonene-1,2-epoxide hydrolase
MSENEQIIQSFIAAWQRLDAKELASYFDDAGCYHNIPAQPVTGRSAIQDFIAGFISTWTETHWEIISLVGQGDRVICERLDRTKTTAGDVDLPCCGVFELENGKTKMWRDYFDMGTYVRAMKG